MSELPYGLRTDTCCYAAGQASAARYLECPSCGRVVRNIDGIYNPRPGQVAPMPEPFDFDALTDPANTTEPDCCS